VGRIFQLVKPLLVAKSCFLKAVEPLTATREVLGGFEGRTVASIFLGPSIFVVAVSAFHHCGRWNTDLALMLINFPGLTEGSAGKGGRRGTSSSMVADSRFGGVTGRDPAGGEGVGETPAHSMSEGGGVGK